MRIIVRIPHTIQSIKSVKEIKRWQSKRMSDRQHDLFSIVKHILCILYTICRSLFAIFVCVWHFCANLARTSQSLP